MEGVDIFNFFTIEEGFLLNPVHTRQIVDPNWGLKITGSAGKTLFGLLAAEDSGPDNKTFFSIARGKYSLGGDNYIGLLYSGHELTGDYNRVLGADFGYRLFKHQRLMASFLLSTNPHQQNETNGTHSTNWNVMCSYSTRNLGITAAFNHIDIDFRMDSSFLMRTGINNGWIWSGYFFHPNSKKLPWLKVITTEFVFQYLQDLNTHMDDVFFLGGVSFNFTRQGYFGINYFSRKESWQGQTFDLSQLDAAGGIQLTKKLQIAGALTWGNKIYYEAEPSYKGKGWDGSFSLIFQPTNSLNQQFNFQYSDLIKDNQKIYNVNIFYSRTTYQFNKYFFLRAVVQYNNFQKRLLTDFLASFTLIPGTVFHMGYGGLYENRKWQYGQWVYQQGKMINTKRSFFLKVSYLWRF
jgi:hypothetical protein